MSSIWWSTPINPTWSAAFMLSWLAGSLRKNGEETKNSFRQCWKLRYVHSVWLNQTGGVQTENGESRFLTLSSDLAQLLCRWDKLKDDVFGIDFLLSAQPTRTDCRVQRYNDWGARLYPTKGPQQNPRSSLADAKPPRHFLICQKTCHKGKKPGDYQNMSCFKFSALSVLSSIFFACLVSVSPVVLYPIINSTLLSLCVITLVINYSNGIFMHMTINKLKSWESLCEYCANNILNKKSGNDVTGSTEKYYLDIRKNNFSQKWWHLSHGESELRCLPIEPPVVHNHYSSVYVRFRSLSSIFTHPHGTSGEEH